MKSAPFRPIDGPNEKTLLFSRYQLPGNPSLSELDHQRHLSPSGRVRGERDRFTLVRIRVQHGKDRPTRRIVCDIVRQRISPQVDISVSSPSNGNPDGVTIVCCQSGSQQAIGINAEGFYSTNAALR